MLARDVSRIEVVEVVKYWRDRFDEEFRKNRAMRDSVGLALMKIGVSIIKEGTPEVTCPDAKPTKLTPALRQSLCALRERV